MKKGLLTLAALCLVASAANAAPVKGKLGIGYTDTISGVNGIAINYGVIDNLHLEGIFGMSLDSPKDNDGMGNRLGFGLGVHFQAIRSEDAALTVGARFALGSAKGATPKGASEPDGVTQIAIDLPVRLYWFASKNLSIHLETGIGFNMIDEKGPALGTHFGNMGEATEIGLFDWATNLGMTFWF